VSSYGLSPAQAHVGSGGRGPRGGRGSCSRTVVPGSFVPGSLGERRCVSGVRPGGRSFSQIRQIMKSAGTLRRGLERSVDGWPMAYPAMHYLRVAPPGPSAPAPGMLGAGARGHVGYFMTACWRGSVGPRPWGGVPRLGPAGRPVSSALTGAVPVRPRLAWRKARQGAVRAGSGSGEWPGSLRRAGSRRRADPGAGQGRRLGRASRPSRGITPAAARRGRARIRTRHCGPAPRRAAAGNPHHGAGPCHPPAPVTTATTLPGLSSPAMAA
jgi:hypothetical protein